MAYTDLLVTLLVKIAAFASLASIALRWNFAKRLFLREQRTLRQRLELAAQFGVVFASASLVRVVLGYRAAEVGLEGAFVSGLVGGYVPGAVAGALISLPAVLGPGFEWATLPLLVGVGSCGGLLRSLAPDPEDVWRFSPFFVFSLVAWIRNRIPGHEGAFQLAMPHSLRRTGALADSNRSNLFPPGTALLALRCERRVESGAGRPRVRRDRHGGGSHHQGLEQHP